MRRVVRPPANRLQHGAGSKLRELRIIASAYAKRYRGKVQRHDYLVDGLPPCLYEVTGRYHRRRLTFRIFDGGCVVEGETPRIASGGISLRRTAGRATVPVPLVGDGYAPRLFREK